jgi:glycerol dehydrogenase
VLQIAPHRYHSASGALQSLGESLEPLGERAFIIANKTALERFEDVVRGSLKESMIGVNFEICLGQCCLPEVERLSDEADKDDADIIVGVGGGKTLDVAKYTAQKLDCKLVTIPSVASSHAAFSNLVYLYSEDGDFLEVKELETAPDLTVVDYKIVGLAPSRHIRAGLGIALATSSEFNVSREELENHQPTKIAYNLASHLRQSLYETGERALEDVKKGEVTGQVESLIEMIILESGLISSLGGMNFRSMIAHNLARQLYPYSGDDVLYGEVAAYGLLVQQLFQGEQPGELTELLGFYQETELPLTLDSLGLPENQHSSILDDALDSVIQHLDDWDLAFEVSRERLMDAIEEADSLGKRVIQSGVENLNN